MSFQTVPLTWLPFLTSVREICLTMQRLEMSWFVDTPVVPELLGEIKGVRDEGLCIVVEYRDGRKWNFPFFVSRQGFSV